MKENYIAVELDLHRSEFGKYLFSHYDILDEIYRSENSQVFKIKQLESNNICVLKAIKKKPFLKFDLEGFKRIRHDNIVLVEHTGESEHFYYMLMEFIEGTTLEKYVEISGPCSTELAQKYIHQICQALQYLHHHYEGQFIYRDLKPSNIMVTQDGKITLIDINTLRMKKDFSNSDTYYIGSKGYTAPEAYGYAQSTETSDVYSLGATLYYLLTGKIPSVGSLFHEEIRTAELNLKYKAIIIKATKFNPKDRYQSVGAFKKAIFQSFVIKIMLISASLFIILAMATEFGINMYQMLEMKQKAELSLENSTDISKGQDASENDLNELVKIQSITEATLESDVETVTVSTTGPSSESTSKPTAESTAVSSSELSTEPTSKSTAESTSNPTAEPSSELNEKQLTTEPKTEHAYQNTITTTEVFEQPNQEIPFTEADLGKMKPADKGLNIKKSQGFINVTYDRTVMEESLKEFKYLCVISSNVPFDKGDLYYLAYEAAVLEHGFHLYNSEGFTSVIRAGDYITITIYDASRKPIGYYFFNEPYEP